MTLMTALLCKRKGHALGTGSGAEQEKRYHMGPRGRLSVFCVCSACSRGYHLLYTTSLWSSGGRACNGSLGCFVCEPLSCVIITGSLIHSIRVWQCARIIIYPPLVCKIGTHYPHLCTVSDVRCSKSHRLCKVKDLSKSTLH
jgi:hypothetical protein